MSDCSEADRLRRYLAPVSLSDFLGQYWETRPLVCPSRERASEFLSLISLTAFDELVACSNLHHPFFRILHRGRVLPPDFATTERIVGTQIDRALAEPTAIYQAYDHGDTVVLVALERFVPAVRACCEEIGQFFSCPVQAYAYLSPANAAGASPHYDTHDVMVLQVEGTKSWRVWDDPVSLPLRRSEDSYDAAHVAAVVARPPKIDATLSAGDVLYIPRGFVHSAFTSRNASLHLSIGIMVYRWIDAMTLMLDASLKQVRESVAFRRSLPPKRRPGEAPFELRQQFDVLKDELLNRLANLDGLTLVDRHFANATAHVSEGQLSDLVLAARRSEPH